MALRTRRCVWPPSSRVLFVYGNQHVVLLVTLFFSGLLLGDSGQDVRVCKFDTSYPVDGVYCEGLDSNVSPCNISRITDYHCYTNIIHYKCRNYGVEYNTSSSGENLTLWNLNGTILPIVLTTIEDSYDTNWLIETQNASVVMVTGLPGNFTVQNPYIFNNQNCPGCPTPTTNWYPYPSKHKIVFEVLLNDKEIQVFGKEILVRLYSSNDSELSNDTTCLMGWKPVPRIINGTVNTRLTIRDIYNTYFCVNFQFINVSVDKSVPDNYNYGCGRHLDMREPPKIPITGEVRIPVWLPVLLASVSAISLMVILILYAAYKGWLRTLFSSLLEPRRATETTSDPSHNAATVTTADITTDTTTVTMNPTSATVSSTPTTKALKAIAASGEKRLSAVTLEQSEPFLNGVGARASEDALADSIAKPRR